MMQQLPPKKKNRTLVWIIGAVAFGCLACIVASAVILYLDEEEPTSEETYGSTIAEMCYPIRGGEESLSNLPADVEYPLNVVVFHETNRAQVHQFHNNLPDEWQADDENEVEAVMCLRPRSVDVEECPYIDNNDEEIGTVIRVQTDMDVVVFSPTGDAVTTFQIAGDEPPECPEETTFLQGQTVRRLTSAAIPYADFENAIRAFVEGP